MSRPTKLTTARPMMRMPKRIPTSIATCSISRGSIRPAPSWRRLRDAPTGHSRPKSRGARASDQGLIVGRSPPPDSLCARCTRPEPAPEDTPEEGRKGATMLQTLAQNWWAIVLRGIFAVLFGLGTFFWPGITLAVLVLLYGGYLFIDG